MSALETEVLEKLLQLDPSAQKRILQIAAEKWSKQSVSQRWDTWLTEIEPLRASLHEKYGGQTGIDVTAFLREVREEDR
jgi:hypothetical protein